MQGRGRRWPKKKPSGSESEEEEHVGQGASSVGSRGVSRVLCSSPLGASALSPARQSCSGLDPCNPLWVSRLQLAAVARSAAPEIVAAGSEARPPPSTLSSLASPAAGRVRHASLRLESPSPKSGQGGPLKPGPASRPASRPCAPPQPPLVLPGAPRPSPPPPTRGRPRPQSRSKSCRILNRDAGWVREAFGALWPGTRGESCGPRGSGLGYAVGGRGRC